MLSWKSYATTSCSCHIAFFTNFAIIAYTTMSSDNNKCVLNVEPQNMTVDFFEAREAGEEMLESVNRLLPQLSPAAKPLTTEELKQLVSSHASHLYLIRVDGKIAGMCTLAIYQIPTGHRAWIEDVVVDKDFRGMKLGRALIEKVMEEVRKTSPCTLMLTSRPSRVAANALYQDVGFESKETNVYKMEFPCPQNS